MKTGTYDKRSGKVDECPVGHETFPVPPACCGVGYRLIYCPAGTVQEETLTDGEHNHAESSARGSTSCLVTDQRVYITFEPCGLLPSEHTTTTKLILSAYTILRYALCS
jgi:hypothetical protein